MLVAQITQSFSPGFRSLLGDWARPDEVEQILAHRIQLSKSVCSASLSSRVAANELTKISIASQNVNTPLQTNFRFPHVSTEVTARPINTGDLRCRPRQRRLPAGIAARPMKRILRWEPRFGEIGRNQKGGGNLLDSAMSARRPFVGRRNRGWRKRRFGGYPHPPVYSM